MPKVVNRVYLSGGGDENQSLLFDRLFFSKISNNGRFLYIPIALKRHKIYASAEKWMHSVLALHNRTDLLFDVARNLDECGELKQYEYIYIGGGNTWDLMYEIIRAHFSNKLIDYQKQGGVIYGGSAGAIILGKNINTHDDKNLTNLHDSSGLNILNNYSVTCHYSQDQREFFRSWAIGSEAPILCIPEESGIALNNNIGQCVGAAPCTVFFPDGDEKQIRPNESMGIEKAPASFKKCRR